MADPLKLQLVEPTFQRAFRYVIGVFMLMLAGIAILLSCFAWLIPFFGGLAFLAGAGNANDEQLAGGFSMILLMTVSPYAWSFMLTGSTIYILGRRKPRALTIMCVLSLALYSVFAGATVISSKNVWDPLTLGIAIPALILVGGIVVAYQMKNVISH